MVAGSAPAAGPWNTGSIEPDPPLLGVSTVDLVTELVEEDDEHPPRRRSPFLTLAIRIVLSAVMLAVLVWRLPEVKWRDLGPRWTSASPFWLVGAGVAMFSSFTLSALRWQRVLSAMRPPPRFRRLFGHFLAGQFVSNVLPTAFGGDVIRVARLGRDLDDHPTAFASVTIERMTGWLVMPFISFIAFAYQPDLRSLGSASRLALGIAAGTVSALVIVLLTASNRRFAVADKVVGWRRFLVAVHYGVDALRRRPRVALEVVGVGFAFQLLQCVALWMAAHAIGLTEVTLGVALAFFPAAAIAQNLPVGLGGLGVREGIFVLFFGALGAPRALSITLGLVIYLLTIVTSSLGAPSFVLGSRRASQNPHTGDVTPPLGGS